MKFTLRTLAAGTTVAALAITGLMSHPALAQEIGLDFWHTPDLRAGMSNSEREAHDLEKKGEVISRRIAVRTETVEDLIAGRVELDEAVRRFEELNRLEPSLMNRVRGMYPGATDNERAGWQLVAHVRAFQHPRARAVADETACRLAYPDTPH